MATRIYVGNLSYSTTDQQLTQLFAPYGEVTEARIIVDRESSQSKGFGFIQMTDDDGARQAIAALNGATVGDRALKVSEAQARPDRANDRPRRGSGARDHRW